MGKHYSIVANWKMYFSFQQAIGWLQQHKIKLEDIIIEKEHTGIICPSFEVLSNAYSILKDTSIALGAQDCSSCSLGAHTGQVAAQSLAQLGCGYCIIGHSEQRANACQTNNNIAQKLEKLLENSIKPIICIGETAKEYQNKKSLSIVSEQLRFIRELLENKNFTNQKILIAYEPIWSIGTGNLPSSEHLILMLTAIKEHLSEVLSPESIVLLYGGSVSGAVMDMLKTIDLIDGFLIGKASTDFQELKKIVLSL